MTVAAALGLSYAAAAQTVSIGPRAGLNSATTRYSGEGEDSANDELKSTAGLQAGVVLNVPISNRFSFQPEVLYSQKGYKFSEGGDELVVKMNYIEVPALLKFHVMPEGTGLFLTAGPTFGYWGGGKVKYNIDGVEDEEDYEFEDEANRGEVGISIGTGIAFPVSSGAVNLDVRYGIGLTSLAETEDDSTMKNRVLGFSVAYLFNTKK